MRLILKGRLESADPDLQCEPTRLASIERADDDLERLLSLEEGRELMAAAQIPVRRSSRCTPVEKYLSDRGLARKCAAC